MMSPGAAARPAVKCHVLVQGNDPLVNEQQLAAMMNAAVGPAVHCLALLGGVDRVQRRWAWIEGLARGEETECPPLSSCGPALQPLLGPQD